MKRIMSLLIMLFMVVSLVLPISAINNTKYIEQEEKVVLLTNIAYKTPVIEVKEIEKSTLNPYEVVVQNMQAEMDEIEDITDKEQWFLAYKDIIGKYSNTIDPPETIYDYFTEEELDLLFRVVQAEVGDEWTFMQKANVSSVIFNRLYSEERDFKEQDTLLKVLTEDQFCTIKNGRYKDVDVSEETILACEFAFQICDTTNGCLFFDNNGSLNYEFVFNDGAHNFYKIGEG